MNKKNMSGKFNRIITVLFISLSVFFFLSTSAFCAGEKKEEEPRMTKEAQRALLEAYKAYENDDWAGARKPLLDYLATNPEVIVAKVYLLLGVSWYSDDKIKEALKVFKKGYETYPDNFELLQYYATLLYENEKFAEAAPMMELVYERDEKKHINHLEAAWGSYYQVQKFTDAIRVLKQLIEIAPEVKQNWYTTIFQIYYGELQDINKAEKFLHTALDKYPMDTEYWNYLSLIRQEKEDYFGMTGALEIITYLNPEQKKSQWNQLILMERGLGLPLREIKNIKKSLNNDIRETDDIIKIAEAYARALKIDKAIAYLNENIKKKPSSKLMLKKAEILNLARRNKDVIAACDELIEVNPDEGNGKAYYLKGNAAWDLKDWRTMEKAFTRAQSYKDYKSYAKYALGFIESLDEAKKQVESDYKKE